VDLMDGEAEIWSGHPTWRATLSYILKGLLAGLILLGIGVLVDWAGGETFWTIAGVIAFLVVAFLTVVSGWVLRRFTVYTITTRRIHMRKGILSKTETSTSLDRLQNITISQSLIDRMLKTGTVDFDTASDDPADTFRFVGIDHPQQLREHVEEARSREADEGGGL
jgi:uncharacterized membrane protein YdbT with pleckstrin-like domain